MQAQANQQSSVAAAQAELQKQEALASTEIKVEQAKNQFEIEKMERQAQIKFDLMQKEFELNMQLKDAESRVIKDKEKYKEDRKDERTRIQASQQSEMIEQRKQNAPPKRFESAGFDNLGGFDLEQFEPR